MAIDLSGSLPQLINAVASVYAKTGEIGIVSGSLPSFEIAVSGETHYTTLTADLPGLSGELTGFSNRFGRVSGDLPNFSGSIAGATDKIARVSGQLPLFTGAVRAVLSRGGAIVGELPLFTGRLAGHFIATGGIAGALPGFSVLSSLTASGARHVVVMNTSHHGVTEYDAFPFESLVEFEGSYYGLTGSGWYLLGGDTDAGAEIAASFTTGDMSYNNGEEMRLLDAKLTARSVEQVKLSVAYDDQTGYDYYEDGDTSGAVKSVRFVPGKGAKGRTVRLTVENTNGGSLEAKQLIMTVADLSRGGR